MRKSYPGQKETERLWLMPPAEGDADAVAEALRGSLAQWLRWTAASQTKAVEEMRKVAAAAGRSNARGDSFSWRMVEKCSGEMVGGVDLHSIGWSIPRCVIGYWGAERWVGQGLVTEAVRAILRVAIEELRMARVEARCDGRNEAAQRLAERVGMQWEGRLRGYERDAAGQLCDIVIFSAVI